MAYNPITNQYDPDTANDFSTWFTPQQQQSNPNLNYIYGNNGGGQQQQPGTIGDGTVTGGGRPPGVTAPPIGNDPSQQGYGGGTNANGEMDPNSPYFQWWLQQHSGNPNPPPVDPATVNMTNPTTVPALTASTLPPPTGPVGTGNPGTDRNNPPGPGYFWSGTANHWVDPTGQHDATGRALNQGEQDYWSQQNTIRAQNTAAGMPTATPTGPGADITNAAPATPATPAIATTAATQPAATTFDYSKQGSVPYWAFDKNVFADTNAQQSFAELQGVMTQDSLAKAQQLYGWQKAADSTSPDANTVYANAIALAKADPNNDYSIVRVDMGNGSVGYGVLKRENGGGNVAAMQDAQSARGFISPAVAIARAKAESDARAANVQRGGGGVSNQQRSVSNLPAPAQPAVNAPGASIDTRMVGGQVNMGSPVEGQIINYNGQMVQYRQGRWVPYSHNGSQQHAVPN